MSSLIVSSAVARVRMIVQLDAATPFGQLGATSGEGVAPSSEIVAAADAGTTAHSARAPAMANRERFIFRFNTTPGRQLRQSRHGGRAVARPPSRLNPRRRRQAPPTILISDRWVGDSDLGDVYCLRPLRTGFLLIRNLHTLGQRPIAVPHDASEMNEKVTSAVVGRDETEPFVVAEPLDGTRCHVLPLAAFFDRTRRLRCPRAPTNPGKVARKGSAWVSGVIRCKFSCTVRRAECPGVRRSQAHSPTEGSGVGHPRPAPGPARSPARAR